uniref:ORF55 n=1 Tax=Nitrosopumilaceae spindle-shaped virus TaxID=3065433 RepID=A0AAT9J7E1_9VIRU
MNKILLFLFLFSIILLPYHSFSVNASSLKDYPTGIHTYYVTPNKLTNMTLIKTSANYWENYGYHLKYSKINPEVIITLNNICNGDIMGSFNKTSHVINIYTYCIVHDSQYRFTEQVLEHELGHFLGFEHTADLKIMHPEIDYPS